ncbi:hypothetical protein UPYG_G00341900 [Umbra pygmaea]|uniref:Uncharacterized protein n=1 Tax=Umbra pygmaea TaxID=75934 RepID=A0ABD0WFS0_UMBPY
MRVAVVLGVLTTLISMALALIVYGQHLTEAKLNLQNLQLDQSERARTGQLKERQWIVNLLEGQVESKKKNLEEMDVEVKKLTEEQGKMKAEIDTCLATKKTTEDELAPIQKEMSDIEASFNTEKETWNGEITNLKKQMEERSKVCDFVKKNSTDAYVMKLCPTNEGAANAEAAPAQANETSAPKQ